MLNIKEPNVAGMFYPKDKEQLIKIIKTYKEITLKSSPYLSRAVIVPHAGYDYSGQIAYEGLSYLNKDAKNIFIFAPAHRVYTEGCVLASYNTWRTPLGDIEVNEEISEELKSKFNLKYFNSAYEEEHAIEVQLPLLQSLNENFKIIPIIVGREDYKNIEKIISSFWNDENNSFVISSDLSHFLKSHDAKKVDSISAQMIENNDISEFHPEQACGSSSICALAEFAKSKNYSLIRLKMLNSGDITGDTSRVVGYGAWFLYEGSKNHYIKTYFSALAKELCKKSIVLKGRFEPYNYPGVFDEAGASFVTLEKDGHLRGCIGSIIASRALVIDLIKNAYSSAYQDPRFSPLREDEFDKIDIKISLLSEPVEIEFSDEDDLLNKITPYKDGIIIQDGSHQALYLPSVWEQLPDKALFLNSLKEKAGMSANHFSSTFRAYKFQSEYI